MSETAELVFIPLPGLGHLLSAVGVAKLIAERDHRIRITILIINPFIQSSQINSYVDSQSTHNPYPTRLNFFTLPPLSNPPDPSTHDYYPTMVELNKPIVKKTIEGRVQSGLPKPVGFVLDMFCFTMIDVATELQIPSYILFTSGANMLNLMFYAQSLADDHGVDVATKFSGPNGEWTVPGFKNPLTSKVIPAVFQDKQDDFQLLLNMTRALRKSKGILVNTYIELESLGIQALANEVSYDKNFPVVYPVGPILNLGNRYEKSSIMQWLDDQPEASVVFLCFGNLGSFEANQVKEIANGLDQSGYRFLWSLRKPPPEGLIAPPSENETFLEALPEGFLERTAERGKIIGWAPQVSILAHKAVGGFVSHVGWNSVLESVWFGVHNATWPMFAEQQLNAFSLVEELGMAVEIRMDYKRDWRFRNANLMVTADEVENGVKKMMCKDEGIEQKMNEMKDKGRMALKNGGSSYNWLGRFIDDALSNVG